MSVLASTFHLTALKTHNKVFSCNKRLNEIQIVIEIQYINNSIYPRVNKRS